MNLQLENARRLLAKAREDAYVLTRLADDATAPETPLGFHAQQAVEKALKAVLAAHGLEYPLTHNLALLLAKLAQHGVDGPPDADELSDLTPFGVDPEELEFDRKEVADRVNQCWCPRCHKTCHAPLAGGGEARRSGRSEVDRPGGLPEGSRRTTWPSRRSASWSSIARSRRAREARMADDGANASGRSSPPIPSKAGRPSSFLKNPSPPTCKASPPRR